MSASASVSTLPNNQADDENEKTHVWNADTLLEIEGYAATVEDVAKKRAALNDQIAAAKSSLVAKGFNRGALQAAISYANTPDADRKNWDETYIFARRAMGCPIQEDLFVSAMQEEITVGALGKGEEGKDDD